MFEIAPKKAKAIAMDDNLQWYWYEYKPVKKTDEGIWKARLGSFGILEPQPKPVKNWEESLMVKQ